MWPSLGPIHTSSTVASVKGHCCSLAQGWHGMGKAQKAKLSWLFYFVTFQRQDLPSWWCVVWEGTPGRHQQRLHRVTGQFQVHHLGRKPFSLSQSPVILVLKTLEWFVVSYKGPLEVEPYGRKAHATPPYQLRIPKRVFRSCFYSSGLLKESGFRTKTPQFRFSYALHLNCLNPGGTDKCANSSGSKK